MPREDKEQEEEQRARTAYDLIRMRLDRLEKNIEKPVSIPQRRDTRKPRPPPDFVRNVVGSSAAAGSAEFHIFRNNRKREMDRLDYMNQKARQEELDAEYKAQRERQIRLEEERTAKKRAKRLRHKEKMKQLKKRKKLAKKQDDGDDDGSDTDSGSDNNSESDQESSSSGAEAGAQQSKPPTSGQQNGESQSTKTDDKQTDDGEQSSNQDCGDGNAIHKSTDVGDDDDQNHSYEPIDKAITEPMSSHDDHNSASSQHQPNS